MTRVALVVLAGILLAACGGPAASTPAATATASAGAPSATQSTAPSVSAAPAASGPAALDPAIPIACYSLNEADCASVLEAALGALPPTTRQVGFVEVGPFGCRAANPCPPDLASRPAGQVVIEPVEGDPVALQVSTGEEPGAFDVQPGQAFTVRLDPSSTPGQLAGGAMDYSLGHCGLGSGVDADGSWWDPTGFVDSDHGDAINAATGTLRLSDPNHATFTSAGGFTVELVRRAGPKHLPLCQ